MRTADWDGRITDLFDLMVTRPDGVTISEIADELGVSLNRARATVRRFRLWFGDSDDINLVCDPDEWRGEWTYKLVGNLADAEGWTLNRLGDMESRLATEIAVLASMKRGIDGRTIEGRKARIMHRAFSRAAEDIAELNSGP